MTLKRLKKNKHCPHSCFDRGSRFDNPKEWLPEANTPTSAIHCAYVISLLLETPSATPEPLVLGMLHDHNQIKTCCWCFFRIWLWTWLPKLSPQKDERFLRSRPTGHFHLVIPQNPRSLDEMAAREAVSTEATQKFWSKLPQKRKENNYSQVVTILEHGTLLVFEQPAPNQVHLFPPAQASSVDNK